MGKSDIRKYTGLIIKRGNEFLVGRILGSSDMRWSTSPWDAWITRKREEAEAVARATGGDVWLFNPIAAQIREAKLCQGEESR